VDKEDTIEFWKSSASESRSRNFLKDSSTLQDGIFFHSLVHIIGKLNDQIFMKILPEMCHSLDKEVPVNFVLKSSGSFLLVGGLCSPSALVC